MVVTNLSDIDSQIFHLHKSCQYWDLINKLTKHVSIGGTALDKIDVLISESKDPGTDKFRLWYSNILGEVRHNLSLYGESMLPTRQSAKDELVESVRHLHKAKDARKRYINAHIRCHDSIKLEV